MRRIAFLDIDGVLNHDVWYNKTKGREGDVDPNTIALLNQLDGVEIVISSSWGNYNGETEKMLVEKGLKLPVVGVTKKWHYQYDWICRGNEIEAWLSEAFGNCCSRFRGKYGNEDYEYVILDDDADMLLEQTDNFIQVNRWVGLTQEDVDRAKSILKIGDATDVKVTKPDKKSVYWVDDTRNPEDYFTPDELDYYYNVFWLKDFDMFKFYIEHLDMPDIVYLDHDLGEGKNGYDCVKFLVEFCDENSLDLPVVKTQSANPVGVKNILSYVESYRKVHPSNEA